MNILLINHYAGSNIYGMEYRPYYFAREWVKNGHNVSIVAASFSHLRYLNPKTNLDYEEETIEGIRYIWLRTPSYQGNGLGRIYNMFSFILKLFYYKDRITRSFKPDVVIASSTYPLDIFPAFKIAYKHRARLVYEVHDLWPLSPIELGGMSPRHPFIIVMQWAENFAYRKSTKVVSMLPKAKEHMINHGMPCENFVYVPNGISIEEWQGSNNNISNEHQHQISLIKEKRHFIVGYAGSHGLANALNSLVETAEILKEEPITFLLVGKGPEKEKLIQLAKQKGLNNVIFLPSVSKDSIPALLDNMDALYIGWNKKSIYRFGICPNKLLDYMMAAKPIIHSVEAGNDLVAERGCGISIPPNNPKATAEAILRLKSMTVKGREIIGLKGKEYIVNKHDYKILAQEFIKKICE